MVKILRGNISCESTGYYDVYLEGCSMTEKPPISVALAYREQIVDSIPVTEQDKEVGTVFYAETEDA
jgi:5-formyltetrahydrofolate cyclo-ligase